MWEENDIKSKTKNQCEKSQEIVLVTIYKVGIF